VLWPPIWTGSKRNQQSGSATSWGMLERATACLDSGARLSVRCARRASRSNRSLGSTFWNHGAGDLDLAPWATAHTTQPPLDVHGSTQLPRRASKKEQEKRVDSPPVESPFLDFLYPPQALALLHRMAIIIQKDGRGEMRGETRGGCLKASFRRIDSTLLKPK
jgi:hypothetical protein